MDHEDRLASLNSLKKGQMFQASVPNTAEAWARVVEQLPEDMKFPLNSALDSLPHNANLCLWNKKKNPNCTLCGERQSLIHVLNACGVAREKRRYNSRHDAVLQEISLILRKYLPPPVQFTVDLGSYNFPQHIVSTDLRPDIVWWDDNHLYS